MVCHCLAVFGFELRLFFDRQEIKSVHFFIKNCHQEVAFRIAGANKRAALRKDSVGVFIAHKKTGGRAGALKFYYGRKRQLAAIWQ